MFPEPSAFRGASLLPSTAGEGGAGLTGPSSLSAPLGNELRFYSDADNVGNWADTAYNHHHHHAFSAGGRYPSNERLEMALGRYEGQEERRGVGQVDLEAIHAQAREMLERLAPGAGGAGHAGSNGLPATGTARSNTSLARGVGMVTL